MYKALWSPRYLLRRPLIRGKFGRVRKQLEADTSGTAVAKNVRVQSCPVRWSYIRTLMERTFSRLTIAILLTFVCDLMTSYVPVVFETCNLFSAINLLKVADLRHALLMGL